jgi:hypothetical protein
MNHSGVTPGTCNTCHNGSSASGKPTNHVQTTASCDACHITTAWKPANFSHSGVAPNSCLSCHNGTNATGKPGDHPATNASCDACHTTTSWNFSHNTVARGSCPTCHEKDRKASKHRTPERMAPNSCDNPGCHNTRSFDR